MGNDFFNFLILYLILTVMFAVVGNMNFIYSLKQFHGLLDSVLTIVDASLGNFDP